MTMTDAASTTERALSRATEALGRADWTTARRLFADALATEETPEALEGLAVRGERAVPDGISR